MLLKATSSTGKGCLPPTPHVQKPLDVHIGLASFSIADSVGVGDLETSDISGGDTS